MQLTLKRTTQDFKFRKQKTKGKRLYLRLVAY